MTNTDFQLYRLRVTLKHTTDGRKAYSKQPNGAYFEVSGENLIFPCGDHSFPMYALAALLPLLPAKQRPTDAADWMTTDAVIADPDPHSGIVYVIERLELETFHRGRAFERNVKRDARTHQSCFRLFHQPRTEGELATFRRARCAGRRR